MAQNEMNERLGLAWKVVWPAIESPQANQNQSEFGAELYGLGMVSKSVEPSKFYEKILTLWWNQKLEFCDKNQITEHNRQEFEKYIDELPKICPPSSIGDEKNNEDMLNLQDYLGFYQPKNGTCGLVAAYHGLYLYKLFSKHFGTVKLKPSKTIEYGKDKKDRIEVSMEFEKEEFSKDIECKDNENNIKNKKKKHEIKNLMCQAIFHSLVLAYEKSQSKIEITIENENNKNDNSSLNNGINTKQRWKCPNASCNEWNNAGNAFCEHCFTDPSMFGNENNKKDESTANDTAMTEKDKKKEEAKKETIESSNSICIVYGGKLPAESEANQLLGYNFTLFDFKMKEFKFPEKLESSKITDENNNYTNEYKEYLNKCEKVKSNVFEFLLSICESDLISPGCCVRLLLSLVLTHSPNRCIYELTRSDSEDIYQDFRDETLVIAPFGFCSQNLVNLCLFGHCRPVIDAPRTCSYGYGFLGHDIINPGSTGFVQRGYGYEHPYFPIWVVLSGTHYTSLFGLPSIGKYNNNNNSGQMIEYDGKHSSNSLLDTYRKMMIWMNTDTTRSNSSNNNNNNKDKKQDDKDGKKEKDDNVSNTDTKNWICGACGFTNNGEYVFCGACAASRDAADTSADASGNTNSNQDVTMSTSNKSGKEEASENVDTNMTTKPKEEKEENDVKMDDKNKSKDDKKKDDFDNIHWELPLASFNGLPPSGPLIAPMILSIISEKMDEKEEKERDRVIDASECLQILMKRGPKAQQKDKDKDKDKDKNKNEENANKEKEKEKENGYNGKAEANESNKNEEMEVEYDENEKVAKLIRCHELVQRIKSKKYNNLYYYELAVSAEQHFEGIQKWKSVYMSKLEDKYTNNDDCLSYFDPSRLPNSVTSTIAASSNSNNNNNNNNKDGNEIVAELDYEYPNGKWRCCSCYLGDDVANKYGGYNDLDMKNCKACGKTIEEGLRTIFVKYEHVPFYVREGKVDKVYEEPLVLLLKKRFRNLVRGSVKNNCLPVI